MSIILVAIAAFVALFTIIELCFYAYRNARYPEKGKVRKRLRGLDRAMAPETQTFDVLKRHIYSDVPFLNRILLRLPSLEKFERLRVQANANYPVGFFILFSLVLAFTSFTVGTFLSLGIFNGLIMGLIALCIPYFYLRIKKQKRMEKFQRQLPEALDLIALSLRAGHAFTSGMKIAADEFDDPMGPELDDTLDEINFGVSVQDALRSLSVRVDCQDLKFFVVSVILQRETGGNLTEIIAGISSLIRERFKFQGKVRALAAEGKFSAIILVGLPFFVVIALSFLKPDFLNILISEPSGKKALGIAGIMMFMGIIVIRKMIRIKV
ncbi:MAG: type II secretion system F family protein [Desulfobacteraceae bacterium]|nr:MAG: type II secretion system F family protein [Desulfobacteraceae bacterium]